MLITALEFSNALAAATKLSDKQLKEEAGAGVSRSYYVRSGTRLLPLKAVARLAYKMADKEWDRLQSAYLARSLRDVFDVVHLTEEDEEERTARQLGQYERWLRPDQAKFRLKLLELFGSECAITGCKALEAIDAAHIEAFADNGSDKVTNGLILRADLHRLFDRHLMSVDADGKVRFSPVVSRSYTELDGVDVHLPDGGPTRKSFASHYAQYLAYIQEWDDGE